MTAARPAGSAAQWAYAHQTRTGRAGPGPRPTAELALLAFVAATGRATTHAERTGQRPQDEV
jgi:hypothetical protein